MKELFIKILSHLNKNALATIVVAMGCLLARYWYNDYKSDQDNLKIDINKVLDGQIKIKSDVQENFNFINSTLVELKQGQTAINLKMDIIKRGQSKPIQQQISQVDAVMEQLRDPIPETLKNKSLKLNNNIQTSIMIPRDSIKKKVYLAG